MIASSGSGLVQELDERLRSWLWQLVVCELGCLPVVAAQAKRVAGWACSQRAAEAQVSKMLSPDTGRPIPTWLVFLVLSMTGRDEVTPLFLQAGMHGREAATPEPLKVTADEARSRRHNRRIA